MLRRITALFAVLMLAAGCAGGQRQAVMVQATPAVATDTRTSSPSSTTPAPAVPSAKAESAPAKAPADKTQPNPTQTPAPAPAPAKPKAEPRLAILVYHDVDELFQSDYTITPTLLEEQVQMLKEEGYAFYTFAEVERLLAGGEGLPEKGVMLAFDDGYQSFVTKVGPVAEKYNVPAVCFVVMKYMSMDIFMGRPHMAPVEMKAAAASPLLDLAGHSWDGHRTGVAADGSEQPVLTQPIKPHLKPLETQAEYEQRVLVDFQKTGELLKEYGVTTGLHHYTFPYTARSEDAVRLGQQAGFRYFYVGGDRLVTPHTDPTAIPRVHAGAPYITAAVLKETLRNLFSQP